MTNIQTNVIHCGDNLEIMRKMPDESVDLIYLDPPFFSGRKYEVIWDDGSEERSFKDTEWYRVECPKCERRVNKTENFCPVCGTNLKNAKIIRKDDIYAYIDWMVPRLQEMYRILKSTGSLYLHVDHNAVHYLKVEMDRIFGRENFINEIVWQRTDAHNNVKRKYGAIHDTILFYSKTSNYMFDVMADRDPLSPAGLKEYSLIQLPNGEIVKHKPDLFGRRLKLENATVPGVKGKDGKILRQYEWRGAKPSGRRSWMVEKEVMEEMLADGRVYLRNRSKGAARCKVSYLDEKSGIAPQDIWYNVGRMKGGIRYPTEKPERLLKRIIEVSSKKGDIVFDPFAGCGTSANVSKKLNRQYIGIDISQTACMVISERIDYQDVILGMQYTNKEWEDMEPHQFQNIVCNTLHAKNTSPNPKKSSGADGGSDGFIKSDIVTIGFEGSPIQVKRSRGVGVNTIKNFESTMRDNNKKNGFVVAISFGQGARDQAKKIRNRGINIILIESKELNDFDFKNFIPIEA